MEPWELFELDQSIRVWRRALMEYWARMKKYGHWDRVAQYERETGEVLVRGGA